MADASTEPEDAVGTFETLDLDPRCLRVLETQEISEPTPIQRLSIPVSLTGKDVICTAQTGTGKTLGYVLPAVSRLADEKAIRNRMLVLVPTRELCSQVSEVISEFARALELRHTKIYGGVRLGAQTMALKKGSDIIVATPGRLLDHMGRGHVDFGDLEILILDEADRMLDMGFLPDIRRILAKLPAKRQTMMFSATFAPELERLASEMLRDPERVAAGAVAQPVDQVRQLLYPVRPEDKTKILREVLDAEEMDSTIVFLRTKDRTDRVGKMLKKWGYNAAVIHGDLHQRARQRALDGFREGRYDILVATDVAARGLDIDDISHVINYDIPENPDDYVHRVGRTARANRDGDAITFVSPSEHNALAAIERAVGRNLPRKEYEGAPPVLSTWKPPGQQRNSREVLMRGGVRRVRGVGRRRR